METIFFWKDDKAGCGRLRIDLSAVRSLIENEPAWGIGTLRRAGIPHWVWSRSSWWADLRLVSKRRKGSEFILAQCGMARRVVLAYRLERDQEGETLVFPSFPFYASGWKVVLYAVALALPGMTPVLALAAGWRWLNIWMRSARLLPSFIAHLQDAFENSRIKDTIS